MTDTPEPDMNQRAERALERSIKPSDPISSGASDPELLARLEAALLSMPKLRREIFLAVRLDAMTYDQIAKVTGLSLRAVERQFARGLCQLDYHLRHGEAPPHRHWWQRWRQR
ncbi:MAG: sigma-70 region 4 domain-containing protein [Sphingomonas sp.]|jgi:RNA polymerase sigma-70 factor (ECF subfamily)|uniref:sigma-70 region 4 domain-containing protein n=1 Tax=Sphingomonas sp. TaxID=28214 RepID=UPI003568829D